MATSKKPVVDESVIDPSVLVAPDGPTEVVEHLDVDPNDPRTRADR
jgi:hypothetical protein